MKKVVLANVKVTEHYFCNVVDIINNPIELQSIT